jgi:hypothetical protein
MGKHLGNTIALVFVLGTAGAVEAEPLVKMDGGAAKPNIVTAWSSSGQKVELTIKDGVDAQAVASAIEGGVDKVKAKVSGGKVVVLGKAEADLLPALAQVDFGGGDDLGALAKNAASGSDTDSGSSLRAKKTVDLDKMFKDQAVTAQGTVADVSEGKFPNAVVTVSIVRAPSGELGKDIRKGKKIKFKTAFKVKGKDIDWSDENNQMNAGAWYLQKNDKVFVKIGKGQNGEYEATIITRS